MTAYAGATDAILVRALSRVYEDVAAVAGADLKAERGEVFALLGPNGAGRTTTLEMPEGYRSRDGGEVSVLGFDLRRERAGLRPLIGIVLPPTGVDRYLTVAETGEMYAGYHPHPRPTAKVIDPRRRPASRLPGDRLSLGGHTGRRMGTRGTAPRHPVPQLGTQAAGRGAAC